MRVARRCGFVLLRQKGSHLRFGHPDGRRTTIPNHGGRELGTGLFHRILKDLGISEQAFDALK